MKRNAKLPWTWRTGDGSANAGKELHKALGPHSALILYGPKWFVVRYLDGDADKFHRNHLGELVETKPWKRRLEIVASGNSPDECLWQVRGGNARAMVGKGFRPVQDANGEWRGFLGADGLPVVGGQLIRA